VDLVFKYRLILYDIVDLNPTNTIKQSAIKYITPKRQFDEIAAAAGVMVKQSRWQRVQLV